MNETHVHKNRNYSIINAAPVKNKILTLRAKGLYAILSVLPEEEYTTEELMAICKEWCKDSEANIRQAIDELTLYGYIDTVDEEG